MAIFNKSVSTHKSTKTDSNTTIITAGSKIKGEMTLSCNLYVDGEFEGTINSTKEINVGKHGHIRGDIVTSRLIVQGFVEGTVSAENVTIKSSGKVSGTLESKEFIIEPKGTFEGTSIVKNETPTDKKPKELKHK